MKSIILSVVVKLLTEKFLTEAFVHVAEHLAAKTKNKLDDKLVASIKKALEE